MEVNEMELKTSISKKVYDLLTHYGWNATTKACDKIVNKWWDAKANLRAMLRNHFMWDEEQQAVIFAANYGTSQNVKEIENFCDWIIDNAKVLKIKEMAFVIPDFYDLSTMQRLDRQDAEQKRLIEEGKATENMAYVHFADGYFMERERCKQWEYLEDFTTVENLSGSIIDNEFVEITKVFGEKLTAVAGQKKSRYIAKLYKAFGYGSIVQMEDIIRNGETIQKDFGWNYHFAAYGDAVNPLNITKYTVFSINILDYLTMSFGKGWASCHCIDKDNVDRRNHTYDGCYMSGTLSYGLDESTAIFYTVDETYEGEMWKAPKDRRMNYHLAPNGKSFCFGRMYPDGRDGGETGLAAQFRKTVQLILATALDENNLWQAPQKGTSACEEHVYMDEDEATNYDDFFQYSDCGMSAMVGAEFSTINVGHAPICIHCGDEHDKKNSLICDECAGIHICHRCGSRIDPDDGIEAYDGNWFCDDDCADGAEYHYCINDGYWHHDNECCHDDYDDDYYYMYYYDGIIPEDDYWYSCREHAENDGWIELCHDGDYDWYRESECETDAYTGERISPDWDESFSPDEDTWYASAKHAILDGWIPTKEELINLFGDDADSYSWERR